MNLLLVHQSGPAFREQYSKLLTKVFRQGLVLEVQDLGELDGMLSRLSIDCLLINLDDHAIDLAQLSSKYPQITLFGLSKRVQSKQGRTFPTFGFEQDFLLELKEMKKAAGKTKSKESMASSFAANFKDFGRLLALKA